MRRSSKTKTRSSRRTPDFSDLHLKAASLLGLIRAERANLAKALEEWRLATARVVKAASSLRNQFTDLPSAAEVQNARKRIKTLSGRQRQILEKILAGSSNKAIAFELRLSEKTVETHRARLMRKVGANSLPELTRIVLRAR